MKKKWRLLGFTLAAAILAGSLSGCTGEKTASGSSSENQTQTINIGTMDLVNGDLIARREKIYEDTLGVNVNIVKFSSGKDVNTALASGSIDVSELGTSPTALGIASGLQYTVIGIGDIIGSAESLVVKKDSGIQSINDLKG